MLREAKKPSNAMAERLLNPFFAELEISQSVIFNTYIVHFQYYSTSNHFLSLKISSLTWLIMFSTNWNRSLIMDSEAVKAAS